MKQILTVVVLGGFAIGNGWHADAQSQATASPQSALKSATPLVNVPALPAPPRGKSTILGGEIRSVDPVRDEITLKVFGQRPVKILFDERTQVFRDGKKMPLRDLGPSDHASVESLLDGTNVYALSIHVLSEAPEGEDQGRVMMYDPRTRELTVRSGAFGQPIKIIVPENTPVSRVGQPVFTVAHPGSGDLVTGSLISIRFEPEKQGPPVAKEISVLASPGAEFVFAGNLTALDMHQGTLLLQDPRDGSNYQLSFDSANLPATRNLHMGDHVIVTAMFDGERYVTTAITINN